MTDEVTQEAAPAVETTQTTEQPASEAVPAAIPEGGAPEGGGLLDPKAAEAAGEGMIKAKDAANWREQFGELDEKATKRLGRFNSAADVFKSYQELEARMSKGDAKAAPMPEDETEAAAWREERGIPATAEGYVESFDLPEGVVLGEADQPMLDAVSKVAHEQGLTTAQLNSVANALFESRQEEKQALYDRNKEVETASMSELMEQHGGEFPGMQVKVKTQLDNMFGEEVSALVAGSTAADGTLLFAHASVFNGFAKAAQETNPTGTMIPAGQTGLDGVESELAKIQAVRSADINAFRKDKVMVARELELLGAQERLSGRA